jgi:nucleoside-diphosphate-sugar epimerase
MGMSVAVTGIGGLFGRPLAAALAASSEVDRIVGLDVAETAIPGVDMRRADVRDRDIGRHLGDCDVLVHLAFILDPMRDEAEMRSINVEGTRNVFESAVDAGVRKIVYTSSAAAYGAHPDNDIPLTEDSPLRANPDYSYGEHKLEVERWLAEWVPAHPEVTTTILRPTIACGRGADHHFTRLVEMPRLMTVRGYRPPFQFTHIEDVVSALEHGVVNDLPGAFNVGCEGWLRFEEAMAIVGRPTLELPEEVAFSLADRLWRMGVTELPAGYLHYAMHPWVMSVDKLRGTGWEPRWTNREALAVLVEDHADFVLLRPGMRVRRRNLKLGAGVAGAALAALALRRILDERDGG